VSDDRRSWQVECIKDLVDEADGMASYGTGPIGERARQPMAR
jgi:hypothetical protein